MSAFPAVVLIVLDGWGLAPAGPGNAVELASTPVFDRLIAEYPHAVLRTDGRAVGLPEGQMGNSEVGHLNLGAGAILNQDLTRIDLAIERGTLGANPVLREACARAIAGTGRMHLVGLVSDGGVHSSYAHLVALLTTTAAAGVNELIVHVFTDGRDTAPKSGLGCVERLVGEIPASARIATVTGRYFAMDRDQRWERTKSAYDALVHGVAAHTADSAEGAVSAAYARGETDEFIAPTVIGGPGEPPAAGPGSNGSRIADGDVVVCFNFRPDRMRQLVRALGETEFSEFNRGAPARPRIVAMTEYHEGWPYPVLFAPERPGTTLSSVIAAAGARQLHVAETEKYPHVTYFFNGGEEEPERGEERCMVQSPKDVATYDLKPEMSAAAAATEFSKRWRAAADGADDGDPRPYRFGVINFANADMVGHSGVIDATVRAVETVDARLGAVVETVHDSGGVCVICADHGNAEQLLEPDGSPNTAHSMNPVPLIVTAAGIALRAEGILADVAPTICELLGIEQPAAMTGRSMITPRTA